MCPGITPAMKKSVLIRQSVPTPARIITARGGTGDMLVVWESVYRRVEKGKGVKERGSGVKGRGEVLKQLIKKSKRRSIISAVLRSAAFGELVCLRAYSTALSVLPKLFNQ